MWERWGGDKGRRKARQGQRECRGLSDPITSILTSLTHRRKVPRRCGGVQKAVEVSLAAPDIVLLSEAVYPCISK